jgi:DNA-binding CsgD family transcriptional regulator
MNINTDSLATIYAAPLEPQKWSMVLDDLASMTGSKGGVLLVERNDGWVGWRTSSALEPQITHQIESHRDTTKSIINARLKSLNIEEFIADHMVFSEAEWLQTPFMYEYGIPNNIKHAVGTFIKLPRGDEILIFCIRAEGEPQYSKKDLNRLNEMRPHLVRAALLATTIGMNRIDAILFAPDKASLPVFVVDADANIIKTNGHSAIFSRYFNTRSQNIVEYRLKSHDVPFVGSVKQIIHSNSSKSIPIKSQDSHHAVVHLMPISSHYSDLFDMKHSSADSFENKFVLAFITEVKQDKSISASILQYLFDLTGAESKITADISKGLTIDEIAAKGSLSKETVRTHLKNVFSKTGVNKQSQLVALVAGIPTR